MWRILQNFPRVLRQTWNSHIRSAPQTVHQDDEHGWHHDTGHCGGNSGHCELLVSQVAKCAKHATMATAACQDSHSLLMSGLNFNREEWRRSHWNSWQCRLGHQHSAFEVLGWGTAVVLGLQLSRFYSTFHRNDQSYDGYVSSQRRVCPLYRLAYGMHHAAPLQILPAPPGSETSVTNQCVQCAVSQETQKEEVKQKHEDTEITQQAELTPQPAVSIVSATCTCAQPAVSTACTYAQAAVSTACTYAQAAVSSDSVKIKPDDRGVRTAAQENVKTPTQRDSEQTDEDLAGDVRSVWNEYLSLADTYVSISNHVLGVQYARAGQYAQAVQYWRLASDAGYSKAQFNLALCYETGRGTEVNLKQAADLYRLAAEADHPQALYNLAVMHLHGLGGLKKDNQQAMQLLEKASAQGLTQAQLWLGILCLKEENTDYEKAAQQFALAAQNGDSSAQFYLAVCYEEGIGVAENECKAVDLYAQAAKRGHLNAKHKLAGFFENGRGGLPEDRQSALDLYKEASDAGHVASIADFTRLQRTMTTEKHLAHLSAVDSGYHSVCDTDATFDLHAKRSTSLLKTSASSPTFTDYIRKHLHKFGLGLGGFGGDCSQVSQRNASTSSTASLTTESVAQFYISEDKDCEQDEERSRDVYDGMFLMNSAGFGLQRSCSSSQLHRSHSVANDNKPLLCL